MGKTRDLANLGAGFLQAGTGAVTRTVNFKLRDAVSVKDFGAVGDSTGASGNGTDNQPAIQAALDYVGTLGGGVVKLPAVAGAYRISSGLKLPTNTVLEGPWGHGYPYSVSGSLVADFSNVNQWIIEPKTTSGGVPIPYNVMSNGGLPSGVTYNCGVRNLSVRAIGTIPYGGVRFHGCPGSFAQGLSVTGVGCGLLVNNSTGGHYQANCTSYYYGAVAWDDVNGCNFDIYSTQDASVPATVPSGYQMPFMATLSGTLVGAYAMSVEHSSRPFGMVIGSLSSLAVNNNLDLVSEFFKGGLFLFKANGVQANRVYMEGTAMQYGIAATISTFNIQGLHAYMVGVGTLFDLGAAINGAFGPGGIINPGNFGTGPYFNDGSILSILRAAPTGNLAPSTPRVATVRHPNVGGPWTNLGAAAGGWINNATYVPQYRINNTRLEFRGFASSGATGVTVIWTLPAGYRPTQLQNVTGGFGAQFSVDTDGTMKIAAGTTFGLDGVSVPLV